MFLFAKSSKPVPISGLECQRQTLLESKTSIHEPNQSDRSPCAVLCLYDDRQSRGAPVNMEGGICCVELMSHLC